MKREELLQNLQNAKSSHLSNMRKINSIIRNQYFINRAPNIHLKECSIDMWLQNEELSLLMGSIFYGDLIKHHSKWHEIYRDLYNKFFDSKKLQQFLDKIDNPKNEKEKERFLVKLSKLKIKLSAREEEEVKALYSDLTNISNKLISTMESCERKVKATASNMFDTL